MKSNNRIEGELEATARRMRADGHSVKKARNF